jgi:hypothetical protein
MTISNDTKTDAAFKFIHGKGYTTTQKGVDNEDAPSGFIIGTSSIFSQDSGIPSTAPGTSTSLLTFFGTGSPAARFRMINDISSPLNLAWYASTDGTTLTTMRNTRVSNWVPPTFGNYTIRIFLTKTTSTTAAFLKEIFFSDPTSPIFDYKTGILTFQSDPLAAYSSIAGGPPDGIQISGYIYVGPLLSQIFDGNGNFTGGLSDFVNSGSGSAQAKFLTTTKSLTIASPHAIGTNWVTETTALFTNPNWNAITVLPNGRAVIVGGNNGLVRAYSGYSIGNGVWFTTDSVGSASHEIGSIWAADDLNIFIVEKSTNGTVINSVDGGLTWSDLSFPGFNTAAYIWGTSTSNIYIAAGLGVIKHSIDGGNTFSPETNSDSHDLHSIWGSTSNDIFVVGDAGTIRHSTGAGTWTGQTSGTANNLRAVFGISSSSVWAGGDNGTMLHYNGTSWSAESIPGTVNVTGIWALSSNGAIRVYACGNIGAQGVVLFSSGDGTWTTQHTFSSAQTLHGIYGSDKNGVYVAGVSGNIQALHHNPVVDVEGNLLVDGYVHSNALVVDHGFFVDGYSFDLSVNGVATNQFLRYDGTSFTAQTVDLAAMNSTIAGRVCMYTTGDNAVTIEPFGIIIDGNLYATPTSGFSLTSEITGFSPTTILYLYAHVLGLSVAIEVSTTIPDPNTGRRTKTGDVSRSYIGSLYVMSGVASGKIKAFRRVDRRTLLLNNIVDFQAGTFSASVLDGSVAKQTAATTTTYTLSMIPPWVTTAEMILSLQHTDVTTAHTVDLIGLGQATKYRLHVRDETLGHEFLGLDPIYSGTVPVTLNGSSQFQLTTDTVGTYVAYLNSYED